MQAYYALAARLMSNNKAKAATEAILDRTKDLLKEFPEEETLAHRTLKQKVPSKIGGKW